MIISLRQGLSRTICIAVEELKLNYNNLGNALRLLGLFGAFWERVGLWGLRFRILFVGVPEL